jgi:hypothetical protein
MPEYEPVLSVPALRVLARLPVGRADRLVDLLARLPLFVEQEAKPVARDAEGRPLHYVVLENRIGVTFWIDHAVCQYRVLQLEIIRR